MKKIMFVILMISFILSGCVSAQDLTEAQSDVISDYAANVLLKHDKYFSEGLVKISSTSSDTTTQEEQNQMNGDSGDTSDTGNTDNGDNADTQGSGTDNTSEQKVSISSAIGLDGFSVGYNGYEVMDGYTENDTISINAYSGNKLLVMKFTLTNTTGSISSCNLLDKNLGFKITLNDETTVSNETTIALSDLSTYSGEVEGNSSVPLVLIAQIPDSYEDNIEAISLSVVVKGNEIAVGL